MSVSLLKSDESTQAAAEERPAERYPEKKLPAPAEIQLRRSHSGALEMYIEPTETPKPAEDGDKKKPATGWIEVRVHRCFPWMTPAGCLSIRDLEGEELAFVEHLEELTDDSARVLREDLKIAGFTLEITRLISLKKEIELRVWTVETPHGARQFQTELDDFPVTLPDGSMLIKDVIGDLYRVSDPGKLDRKSRKMLWGFLN